jgi:hypothetical protein
MSLSCKVIFLSLAVIGASAGFLSCQHRPNPFYSDLSSVASEQELKQNYQTHAQALYALKDYFNSIAPADSVIDIEFEDVDRISLKIYSVADTSGHTEKVYFAA